MKPGKSAGASEVENQIQNPAESRKAPTGNTAAEAKLPHAVQTNGAGAARPAGRGRAAPTTAATQGTDAASHAAATTAAPGAGQAAHPSGSAAPGPYRYGESNSPGAHAQARAQIIIKQSTKGPYTPVSSKRQLIGDHQQPPNSQRGRRGTEFNRAATGR